MNTPPSTTQNKATLPPVVTADEWQARLQELAQREEALTAARLDLTAARRRMPMTRVDKDYRFIGPDGEVGLTDLFAGRRQLILYRSSTNPMSATGRRERARAARCSRTA